MADTADTDKQQGPWEPTPIPEGSGWWLWHRERRIIRTAPTYPGYWRDRTEAEIIADLLNKRV